MASTAFVPPRPAGTVAAHRSLMSRWGWLSRIDAGIAQRLLDMVVWRSIPEGTIVYQAGSRSCDVFGVVSGQVVLWHHEGSTDAQFVHMFRAGQWFGYAPLLAGESRRHQCVTRSQCEFAVLPEISLRAFLAEDPEHWHALALLIDMQGQASELAGLDLLRRSPEARMAATLLRFAGCRLKDAPDGPPWDIAVTQMELAEASNMCRNAASRMLVKMEKAGLVALHYRQLALLDATRVRALLDE